MHLRIALTGCVVALLAGLALANNADAKPTVLVIHGGSWYWVGPAVTASTASITARFARDGWRATNLDYRRGRAGFEDLLDAYDSAAANGDPVCAYGESAGGHLALMLAEARPALNCVVAVAAPTDLLAPDMSSLRRYALVLLGPDLLAWSPLYSASRIKASVLLINGADDTVVPLEQGERMDDALTGTHRLIVVRSGGSAWMHGTARPTDARRARRAGLRWVNRVERAHVHHKRQADRGRSARRG